MKPSTLVLVYVTLCLFMAYTEGNYKINITLFYQTKLRGGMVQ